MNKLKLNYKKEKIVLLFVIILLFIVCFYIYNLARLPTKSLYTYENKSYGFQITLPASWNPVKTIITEVKIGGFERDERGLSIGYLTSDGSEAVYFYNIYAIPISSWAKADHDYLFELGRNNKYVFAFLPKSDLMATNQNGKQGMCEDNVSLLKEKELCAAYGLLKNNIEKKSFKVFNFKAFDPHVPDRDWKKFENEKN